MFFDRELTECREELEADRYRAMIEHGPAVSYIDATDEKPSTIFVSPQIHDLLGYSPHEWVEDPEFWPKLLHPDDELTGLPSGSMFDELLDLSVARAKRHDGAVAVIAVDIDDFRLVNDSLGHSNGDEILRLVADRLWEASRETDLVARRGGDQFLMLLADLEWEANGERETGDRDS